MTLPEKLRRTVRRPVWIALGRCKLAARRARYRVRPPALAI